MTREEIDKLVNDVEMMRPFHDNIIETVWCSSNSRNGDTLKLIVVVYPFNDMLQYRLEFHRDSMMVYDRFADALLAFEGMQKIL